MFDQLDEKTLNEALGNPDAETQGAKGTEAADPEKGKQSKEENSRYAAARRKAESEKDKAIREAKEKADEEKQKAVSEAVDAVYAEMGLTNPYTGKKIESEADYLQYKRDHAEKLRKKAAEKTGLSKEEFDAVFPDTKKQEEEKNNGKADEKISAELKEIASLAPNYKTLDDIVNGSHGKEFSAFVKKNGLSFKDAFRLAYGDEIERAAKPSPKGKDHLQSTVSVGAANFEEPDETTLTLYREMMPDLSDEEIIREYQKANKYLKSKRG